MSDSARVLITGGAAGLGAALARRCAARGDRVLVGDVAEPIGPFDDAVEFVRLDVRSDDDWAAAVDWVAEHWGGLDVLVNNAGVAGGGRVDVAEIDEWQWMFEINVFGIARGTRAFAPMLKAAGGGRIVNVASLAGLVHPAGMGSYNAAKAAVVAFTETTGHELASHGVTAHAVCPSYFRTDLVAGARGHDAGVREVIGALVAGSPLSADDIAAEILRGLEAGEELILPDPAAREAHTLKLTDRAAYDAVMRRQAAKLESLVEPGDEGARAETPSPKEAP